MMDVYGFFTHRRLRLLSGIVMFAYISSHLLNHGLGVVSLALAESGLRLEMAFWRTPIMTILLYGAVAIHFALALWTLYSRRDWRLPGVEALRLAAGFSFPLLLINHAVSTRLGDALFGITPSYTLIIANLLAAGRQGMQLALLAPGWLHGCLGLWITLQRFRAMQRIKRLLAALVILIPVVAAAGFLRMSSEVLAIGPQLPTSSDALLHKMALASWDANLIKIYLGAVFSAFLLGRLHSFWPRLFRAGPFGRGISRQMTQCPRTAAPSVVDRAAKGHTSALGQKQTYAAQQGCLLWARSGHDDMSGGAATAGERGVSLSARFLRDQQRSTGSDCKSHDCLPPHSVGILPTSDTDSPNGHHLCLPHTRETRRPLSAVDRRAQQEQRRRRKSRGPSSTSVVGAGNNAER